MIGCVTLFLIHCRTHNLKVEKGIDSSKEEIVAELGESGQEEAINEVQWPQLVAASTVAMPYQLVAPATVTVSSTPINMIRKASPLTVGYGLNLAPNLSKQQDLEPK